METFEEALARWQGLVKASKEAAAAEKALRDQLVAAAFPQGVVEGVQKRELADGTTFKVTGKMNRTVDEASVAAVKQEIAALGQNEVTADDVFTTAHKLSMGAYKKLTAEGRKAADKAIVAKPGSPMVEWV